MKIGDIKTNVDWGKYAKWFIKNYPITANYIKAIL